MDRLRLRFWNALEHFGILLFVFSGALAFLEYTGKSPHPVKRILVHVSSLGHLPLPPPAWVPPAFVSLFLAAVAYAASRRRELWHPSGFVTLPAPNGGYLRKAKPAHLNKELSRARWKTRRAARAHFRRAEGYFAENQYLNAATEYRKSASEFATMSAHLNEGISLCYTSRFRNSAEVFEEGLSKLKSEDRSFASAFHCSMSIACRELGKLEAAHASFKEAYRVCASSGDSLGRLCALGNSGTLYLKQGEPGEALESWQYVLEGLADIPCGIALAIALDGIGAVFTGKEEYRQALRHHRKALKIFRRHRSVPGTTGALANIRQAHAKLGRRWRSLSANRKALKLAGRYGYIFDQTARHASN